MTPKVSPLLSALASASTDPSIRAQLTAVFGSMGLSMGQQQQSALAGFPDVPGQMPDDIAIPDPTQATYNPTDKNIGNDQFIRNSNEDPNDDQFDSRSIDEFNDPVQEEGSEEEFRRGGRVRGGKGHSRKKKQQSAQPPQQQTERPDPSWNKMPGPGESADLGQRPPQPQQPQGAIPALPPPQGPGVPDPATMPGGPTPAFQPPPSLSDLARQLQGGQTPSNIMDPATATVSPQQAAIPADDMDASGYEQGGPIEDEGVNEEPQEVGYREANDVVRDRGGKGPGVLDTLKKGWDAFTNPGNGIVNPQYKDPRNPAPGKSPWEMRPQPKNLQQGGDPDDDVITEAPTEDVPELTAEGDAWGQGVEDADKISKGIAPWTPALDKGQKAVSEAMAHQHQQITNGDQAIAHMRGDGATDPQTVAKIEEVVDPEGKMSPSERKLAAAGAVTEFGMHSIRNSGLGRAATAINSGIDAATGAIGQLGDRGAAAGMEVLNSVQSMLQTWRQDYDKNRRIAAVHDASGDARTAADFGTRAFGSLPSPWKTEFYPKEEGPGYTARATYGPTGEAMQADLTPQQYLHLMSTEKDRIVLDQNGVPTAITNAAQVQPGQERHPSGQQPQQAAPPAAAAPQPAVTPPAPGAAAPQAPQAQTPPAAPPAPAAPDPQKQLVEAAVKVFKQTVPHAMTPEGEQKLRENLSKLPPDQINKAMREHIHRAGAPTQGGIPDAVVRAGGRPKGAQFWGEPNGPNPGQYYGLKEVKRPNGEVWYQDQEGNQWFTPRDFREYKRGQQTEAEEKRWGDPGTNYGGDNNQRLTKDQYNRLMEWEKTHQGITNPMRDLGPGAKTNIPEAGPIKPEDNKIGPKGINIIKGGVRSHVNEKGDTDYQEPGGMRVKSETTNNRGYNQKTYEPAPGFDKRPDAKSPDPVTYRNEQNIKSRKEIAGNTITQKERTAAEKERIRAREEAPKGTTPEQRERLGEEAYQKSLQRARDVGLPVPESKMPEAQGNAHGMTEKQSTPNPDGTPTDGTRRQGDSGEEIFLKTLGKFVPFAWLPLELRRRYLNR